MADEAGLSSQYPRASPWPVVIVLGLVFSEIGILFGVAPLSIGGLLLLSGSVVGILRETGYANTLWGPGLLLGSLFTVVGGVIFIGTTGTDRAIQIGGAGIIVVVVAITRYLVDSRRI